MIQKTWKAKDSTEWKSKIALRKKLLEEIKNPSILDCFAGEGKMYKHCYAGMEYTGLDTKKIEDGRIIINIDNVKFLRTADLSKYNFFDLDAYGSPWHQFLLIVQRRKLKDKEKIAIAITDGLQLSMDVGDIPKGLKPYINIPRDMKVPCLGRHRDFIEALIIKNAVAVNKLKIVKAYRAENKRGNMHYLGIILSNNDRLHF